jgi:putative glutamine amidotransferase
MSTQSEKMTICQKYGIKEDTDYSSERDVSDYILLSYCLEKDIPILAICRGMQMLSIVSGADIIQDIGQWYEEQGIKYSNDHRDVKKENFVAHSVSVTSEESHLSKITGKETIDKVPSWHHQAVGNIDNTRLVKTAQAETDNRLIIEGVERPDKTFCVGVQFHPEVAVRKYVEKEKDADSFMDRDTALSLFKALIDAGHGK